MDLLVGVAVTIVLAVIVWAIGKRFKLSPQEKSRAGIASRFSEPPQ